MKKNTNYKPLFDRRGKSGAYAVVVSLILLAVLIVVNMIVGSLPSKLTKLDTSAAGQFDISGTTENFISKLKEKITFYYICSDGSEDSIFDTFVERYASMNSNISIVDIDPVKDPEFLTKYNADELNENSIIIESEKRFKVIDYTDFYLYVNAELGAKLSYEEYVQYGMMYEQYYGYNFTEVQYFDSVLTLGIEYTIAEKIPSMYLLNGHGEAELADVVAKNLDYLGMSYDQLNLALGEKVPEDCTCLVLNNPTSDITDVERAAIEEYLEGGGNILLMTSKGVNEYKNITALASAYGLTAEAGTVNEGDSSAHVSKLPGYIYAQINESHDATSVVASNGLNLLLADTHAINIAETENVKTTALFTTTAKAFNVIDGQNGEAGVKNLGVVAEKSESSFCWVASGAFISDAMVSNTNGGNFYGFYGIVNWMTGNYTSELPDIPGVELSEPRIATTATDINIWGSILIFIIPIAILGGGIAYSVYRRRR